MPRKPRPQITPAGVPEPNRTDLMAERTQPLSSVPTGQPYGAHKAETDFIRAAPMQAVPPVPTPPAPQAPGGTPGFGGAVNAALAAPPPQVTPLTAPSTRPNEPTTAGLPVGAGAGPEILQAAQQTAKVSATYLALYQQTGDETFRNLANAAFARGQ